MEELEELIEDADRDGSGSVDFQVTYNLTYFSINLLLTRMKFLIFSPEDEMFDVISRSTDDCNLYGVELNLDRDRAQCNNHQLFVIVSPIMSPQLLLIVANFQPNYFLDKLGPTSQVISPKVHPSLW